MKETVEKIKRMLADTELGDYERRNLNIMYDIYSGRNIKEIADKYKVSTDTIYRIKKKYQMVIEKGDIQSIKKGKSLFTYHQIEQIKEVLSKAPNDANLYGLYWTANILWVYLYKKFDIQITARTCSTLIREYGKREFCEPNKEIYDAAIDKYKKQGYEIWDVKYFKLFDDPLKKISNKLVIGPQDKHIFLAIRRRGKGIYHEIHSGDAKYKKFLKIYIESLNLKTNKVISLPNTNWANFTLAELGLKEKRYNNIKLVVKPKECCEDERLGEIKEDILRRLEQGNVKQWKEFQLSYYTVIKDMLSVYNE